MLYLLGVSHRSAPVELRERLHFSAQEIRDLLPELCGSAGVQEAVILSTCNRTELLLSCASPQEGAAATDALLNRARRSVVGSLDQIAYRLEEHDAVRHLFRVAASLDSMIIGEPQILGQAKEAYALASGAGTVGPVLSGLMQRAFACGKKIRTDTGISRHPVSLAYAAAGLAEQIFGSLRGRSIMVLGAGKMGKLTARHLAVKGVKEILVASRTFDHARRTAEELGGQAIAFDDLIGRSDQVDVMIVSTAAPIHILKREHGPGLMKARRHRPIFIIDLAVPRNVDPALNDLDNLFLYNVDDLQAVADEGREERIKEARLAEEIVEQETASYFKWVRSLDVQPTIVELRRRFQQVAGEEFQKRRSRFVFLDAEQERAISGLLEAVVNKLLHAPTVTLKRALQERDGTDLVAHTRRLFDLGDEDGTGGSGRESSPAPGVAQPGVEAEGGAGDESSASKQPGGGSPFEATRR